MQKEKRADLKSRAERNNANCRERRRGKNARRLPAAACAALLALWPAGRAFPQNSAADQASAPTGAAAGALTSGAAIPFRVGETLKYRVEWSAFSSAAEVELSVPERRDLYGWQTWHFRAAIHTLGSVRSLFQIDDQFDSYSDASTFASHQFEEHLDELGRTKNEVLHLAASGEESKGPGPFVAVLPGTHDPLGMLYELRSVDWQRTPRYQALVYDGKNLYEMHARRDIADESVSVAAGRFSTSRISIRLFRYQKPVAGMQFEIWLANTAARTPVVMRADLPFGNVRAELISATN